MTPEEIRILNCGAFEHFGEKHQIIKCIEEMSELTKVLSKWVNLERGETHRDRIDYVEFIREEIADVSIMISQMKHFFGEQECFLMEEIKRARLKRTLLFDKREE